MKDIYGQIGVIFLLINSCAFDDVHLYEIKLNEFGSITYLVINGNDSTGIEKFELYSFPDKKLKRNKRIELRSSEGLEKRKRLEQACQKVIYNNSCILVVTGSYPLVSKKYYRYQEKIGSNILKKDTLSVHEFDSISSHCIDCEDIDVSKIRNLKWK